MNINMNVDYMEDNDDHHRHDHDDMVKDDGTGSTADATATSSSSHVEDDDVDDDEVGEEGEHDQQHEEDRYDDDDDSSHVARNKTNRRRRQGNHLEHDTDGDEKQEEDDEENEDDLSSQSSHVSDDDDHSNDAHSNRDEADSNMEDDEEQVEEDDEDDNDGIDQDRDHDSDDHSNSTNNKNMVEDEIDDDDDDDTNIENDQGDDDKSERSANDINDDNGDNENDDSHDNDDDDYNNNQIMTNIKHEYVTTKDGQRLTKATKLDCIFLRSPTAEQRSHAGNFNFRTVIIEHSKQFREAVRSQSLSDRSKVIDDVLDVFRTKFGGRLLEPPGGSCAAGGNEMSHPDALWEEMDVESARIRVGKVLKRCIAGVGFHAIRDDEELSPEGKLVQLKSDSSSALDDEGKDKAVDNDNDNDSDMKTDDSTTKSSPVLARGKRDRRSTSSNSSVGTSNTRNNEDEDDHGEDSTSPNPHKGGKIEPTKLDYLVMKGGTAAEKSNPGTLKFRQILDEHSRQWVMSPSDTYEESRKKLMNSIYDTFRATGGRIIAKVIKGKNKTDTTWVELSKDETIQRIKKHSAELKRALTPRRGIAASHHRKNANDGFNGNSGNKFSPSQRTGRVSSTTQSTKKHKTSQSSSPNSHDQISNEKVVYKPNDEDYLCISTGNKMLGHPGVQNYRRVIHEFASKYQSASTSEERTAVVEKAYAEFSKGGGRILIPHSAANKVFDVVSEEESLERIRRSFACHTSKSLLASRASTTVLEGEKRGTRHGGSLTGGGEGRGDGKKIYKPNKEDYLHDPNGPTKAEQNNPGNLQFDLLIESRAVAYCTAATTDRKLSIESSILTRFHKTGGRILRKVSGSTWYEMDDNSAQKLISKALEDCFKTYRKNDHSDENETSDEEVDEDDDDNEGDDEEEDNGSDEPESGSDENNDDDEERVVKLSPKDCLCIMNPRKGQLDHPGTHRFNEMIEKHCVAYFSSANGLDERRGIREKIVDDFQKTGGRFVAPLKGNNEPGCLWVEVDYDIAVRKVGNAFRRIEDKAKRRIREMAQKEKSTRQQNRRLSNPKKSKDQHSVASAVSSEQPTLVFEDDLRPTDFVFCAGGRLHSHPGCHAVKKIVESSAQLYHDSDSNVRKSIRDMIVATVHAYGGRFLISTNGLEGSAPWTELDDIAASRKITRKLRECPGVDRSSPSNRVQSGCEQDEESDYETAAAAIGVKSASRHDPPHDADVNGPPTKKLKTTSLDRLSHLEPKISPNAIACGDYEGSIHGASTGYDEYGIGYQEDYSDIEDIVI